jgi:hypothetical protein
MFDDIFGKWEARIGAAAAEVGQTAAAYAERIIAQLEVIAAAVTDPEFDNRIEDFEKAITAAVPATFEVPPGETWELFYLSSDVDAVVTVRHGTGGRLRGRWDTARPPQTQGLILRGGSEFSLAVSVDAYVYAQFKVSKPARARATKQTGMPTLSLNGQNTVDENVGRHGPGNVARRPMPGVRGDTGAGATSGI